MGLLKAFLAADQGRGSKLKFTTMTPAQGILAFWMLITGSINTLSTKYADKQCVPDYTLADAPVSCAAVPVSNTTISGVCPVGCKQFDHPFAQALGMFAGETLCMLAFKLLVCAGRQGAGAGNFPPWIFALPALCDCLGTSLMYAGLSMTYASVFQMLRGSVVVFTGILSVIFLKRNLRAYHWLGMALVSAGALIVGSSSLVNVDPPADGRGGAATPVDVPSNPLLGNMLIVGAQLIVAVQMVIEEKFLSRYNVHALEAVGWEGLFGCLYLSVALTVMYFLPFGPDQCGAHSCVENALHAAREVAVSPYLAAAIVGNVLSIACFNFCGVSVTQSLSATHRMVLDSLRTVVIWAVSLYIGWQDFNNLQVHPKP